MSKGDRLVEVYRARTEMEAQVIKSMLESFGIECLIRTGGGLKSQATLDMGNIGILCLEARAGEARELIQGQAAEDQEQEEPSS